MPHNASPPTKKAPQLHCSACGNDTYFIEMMERVANLVDANMQHVHLLIGAPDRYYCRECGELYRFGMDMGIALRAEVQGLIAMRERKCGTLADFGKKRSFVTKGSSAQSFARLPN